MAKYHISADGNVRQCRAQTVETCRATSRTIKEHFGTKEEASAAYEAEQKDLMTRMEEVFSSEAFKQKSIKPKTKAGQPGSGVVLYSNNERIAIDNFAQSFVNLAEGILKKTANTNPQKFIAMYKDAISKATACDIELQKNPFYKSTAEPYTRLLREMPVDRTGLIPNMQVNTNLLILASYKTDIINGLPLGTTMTNAQKKIDEERAKEEAVKEKRKLEEMKASLAREESAKARLVEERRLKQEKRNTPIYRLADRIFGTEFSGDKDK